MMSDAQLAIALFNAEQEELMPAFRRAWTDITRGKQSYYIRQAQRTKRALVTLRDQLGEDWGATSYAFVAPTSDGKGTDEQ